jgi:hypothetical protein
MFDDIYEYVKIRNGEDTKFITAVKKQYQRNALFSNWIMRAFLKPLFQFMKPRTKVQFLFFSNKYSDIIINLPKGSTCIIGGPKQIRYCLKNKIPLISNINYWKILYDGLANLKASDELTTAHYKFSSLIRPYITNETVFIVDNDSMPMQRAIINVMKELNIKVCLIQDGLFQSLTPANHIHGWKSDIILCYDNHQQKILQDKIKTAVKVRVVGFYKPIKFGEISKAERKICFLGQPWFKYGTDYQNRYLEIYKLVHEAFPEKSLSFKLHPWEMDAPYVNEIKNKYIGTMNQALNDFDCFISLTSTALYEATLAGKVSIQILDDKFECDDFQSYGYAYSATVDDIKKGTLKNIIEYDPINEIRVGEHILHEYIDYFRLKKYTLD